MEGGRGAEREEEREDQFDRLPDSLLLSIFNCLHDVKSLGRCSAVSLRFRSLAVLTDRVVVRVDCVISADGDCTGSDPPKSDGILGSLAKILLRPIHALHEILLPKKILPAGEISHHSPSEVLRNFREIRTLEIVLPTSELRLDSGAILKWNAEFGSSLEKCAIFCANSLSRRPTSGEITENLDSAVEDQSFCRNGGLKLRVVWTITSLIAASARHFLFKSIVLEHPSLQRLEITDVDGQGTLRMRCDQLEEFPNSPLEPLGSSKRTLIPALNMKLWYAPRLELKSGYVMEGATFLAIRPADVVSKLEIDEFMAESFGGPFREAAQAMMKRKSFHLEMNSF